MMLTNAVSCTLIDWPSVARRKCSGQDVNSVRRKIWRLKNRRTERSSPLTRDREIKFSAIGRLNSASDEIARAWDERHETAGEPA
jgi:hypothetical protein